MSGDGDANHGATCRVTEYHDDYPTCLSTYATLRIYPGDVLPDDITSRLKVTPTSTQVAEERPPGVMNATERVAYRRIQCGFVRCESRCGKTTRRGSLRAALSTLAGSHDVLGFCFPRRQSRAGPPKSLLDLGKRQLRRGKRTFLRTRSDSSLDLALGAFGQPLNSCRGGNADRHSLDRPTSSSRLVLHAAQKRLNSRFA